MERNTRRIDATLTPTTPTMFIGRSAAILAAIGLAALSLPAAASVYVGNPKLTVDVSPGQGLVFDTVTFDRAVPRADACAPVPLNGGQPVELLGTSADLPVDACALGMETGGTVTIEGHGVNGGSFELVLGIANDPVYPLVNAEPLWPDGSSKAFVLELADADWVTAASLGLDPGEHIVVDAGHPLYNDLVQAIEADSAIFRDVDGDGVISPPERSAGPLN